MLVNTKVWKEQEFAFLCFLFIEVNAFLNHERIDTWSGPCSVRRISSWAVYKTKRLGEMKDVNTWKTFFLVVISTTFSGDMLIFRRGMFLMFTHLFRKWSDFRICSLKLKPRILVYKILPNSPKTTNFRYTPHPVTVTTRTIPFFVGNPGIPN